MPLPILSAITRAETGRASGGGSGEGVEPWPWTVQSGGVGEWFRTREEALARADALLAAGETNLDLGCFQLNLHWHAGAFSSMEEMLDPQANALYAAGFLLDLYAESGDWREAAAHYHSRDPERAEAYAARLESLHAQAGTEAPPPSAGTTPQPVRFGLRPATGAILTAARGPLIGGF